MNIRRHIITLSFNCIICGQLFAGIIVTSEKNKPLDIQTNIDKAIKTINDKIKKLKVENTEVIINSTDHLLQESVKPYGFYHASITHTIKAENNNTIISFKVNLGEPMKIKSFSLNIFGEGKDKPYFNTLIQTKNLAKGKTLNTEYYKDLKDQLYQVASNNGYFDAKITHSNININLKNNTADITIVFNSNKQYKIGKTSYSKTYYDPSFVKKFITYKAGETYNIKKLNSSQKNFVSTPYFTQAIIVPVTKDRKNGKVPIKITLMQKMKKRYSIGLGYDNKTNFHLLATFENNRMNAFGQQLSSSFQFSKSEKNLTLNYKIPSSTPEKSYYTISGGASRLDLQNGNSKAAKIKISKTINNKSISSIYAINFLKERYNLSNLPKTTANLIFPSASWRIRKMKTVNQINNSGYASSLTLAGAPNELAKKDGFMQAIAKTNLLYTLPNQKTRLLIRGTLAKTEIKNILNLPLSMQLYAGGSGSIRGYNYHSLPASTPGRNLYTASIEAQQQVYNQVYLTGFFDIGNVTNNKNIFKNSKSGAGAGIAIVTSLGTFEVTAAKPLTEPHHKWVFQFSMEPTL